MASHARPDPGGVFDSDAQRRVLALLPNPDEEFVNSGRLYTTRVRDEENMAGLLPDDFELVINELKESGYAEDSADGVRSTQEGFDALTGPIANEPAPLSDEAVAAREAENEQHLRETEVRAAEGRIEANEQAIQELQEAIQSDQAIVAGEPS